MPDNDEPTLPSQAEIDGVDEEVPTLPDGVDASMLNPMKNALGLADPNYAPNTNSKIDLQGIDFTEPNQADISKYSRLNLGVYLRGYTRHGRSGDDTSNGNPYYPPQNDPSDMAPSHHVGDEIPPPSALEFPEVSQFVDQGTMEQIEAAGLGVGRGLHTPGNTPPDIDGDAGQIIGTFFTQDQIDEVLDKTGGDKEKLGSKLSQKILAINHATKANLIAGNRYRETSPASLYSSPTIDDIENTEKREPNYGPDDGASGFVAGAMPAKPESDKKGVFDKEAGRLTIQEIQKDTFDNKLGGSYDPSQLGADPTKPKEKNIYQPNPPLENFEYSHSTQFVEEIEGGNFYEPVSGRIGDMARKGVPFNYHQTHGGDIDPGDPDPFLFNKTAVGPGGAAELIRKVKPGSTSLPAPGDAVGDTYATIYNEADPLVKETLDMLKEYNLYSPSADSPFFIGGVKDEEVSTQGLFTIQRELGRFVPEAGVTAPALTNSASGKRVTVTDMGAMAMSLLAEATGDTEAASEILSSAEVDSFGVTSAAVLGLAEQMGLYGAALEELTLNGIPGEGDRQSLINAATGNSSFMMRDSTGDDGLYKRGLKGPNDGLPNLVSRPYNSTSYGQLNSFLEPFMGGGFLGATGMLVIAITSVVAIIAAGLVIELISGQVQSDKTDPTASPSSPENLALGMHGNYKDQPGAGVAIKEFFMRHILGIPKTDFDFGNCVGGGMCLMVGFPGQMITTGKIKAGTSDMTQLMNFFINLVSTPGYYANYLRVIVMSTHAVTSAFAELSGFSSGFEGIFNAITKLTESKIWKFVMTSAAVGDANLKSYFGVPGRKESETLLQLKPNVEYKNFPNPDHVAGGADMDTILPEDYAVVAGLRKNITRWGTAAYKNPLSLSTFLSSQIPDKRTTNALPGLRRVAPEEVPAIEQALSAEYVPFYFHDLRTNEIISAPAFITSLDESYTAQYATVDGYGRQDSVRTHQKTERTINMGFKLVAFGDQDHDALWYTVNKIVSMLYPQYSQGVARQIMDKDKNRIVFTQPFSQVPVASPLIRIRIGDVIKSNYSTKNMMRMFGYADEETDVFKVKGKVDPSVPLKKLIDDHNVKLKNKYSAVLGGNYVTTPELGTSESAINTFKFVIGSATKKGIKFYCEKVSKNSLTDALPALGPETSKDMDDPKLKAILSVNPRAKSRGSFKDGVFVRLMGFKQVTSEGMAHDCMVEAFTRDPESADPTQELNKTEIKGLVLDLKDFQHWDFPAVKKFIMNTDVYKKESNKQAEAVKAEFTLAASNFFDPNNNAIVRSFESTRGRGLAGFIFNLNMNLFDSTWDITPGKAAPMVVDIRLTFMPINDLPVGLDSNGRLQALTYPVGALGNDSGWGSVAGDSNNLPNAAAYNKRLASEVQSAKRGGPDDPKK